MKETRAVKGIVIDAGHGGDDPGAVANGFKEKDFNLEAARYMYKRFQELGAPVTLIRNSDETINPEERVRRILAAYGDNPNVIVISNHINSGGGEGAEVIYALRNNDTLARSVLENIGAKGQVMRKYYQRRLPENPSRDYYFIHRNTGSTQPLLVEYGFIDNDNDIKRLQNNLLDFVEGVVKAVAEYSGIRYIPPTGSGGSNNQYYIVQKDDTLWKIAQKLGTTVDKLKEVNNLTSDNITPGQTLIIPGATPSPNPPSGGNNFITYTVKLNDSLYKIANQFGVTVQDIIDANNLSTTVLEVGQQLRIPNQGNNDENPEGTTKYTVELNDSLWYIANKFNTTVDAIKQANNLTSNELQIGQVLIIPTTNTTPPPSGDNTIKYTVELDDSLWYIANKFNTTVDAIKKANNLTSNALQVGQILIIPNQNNTPSQPDLPSTTTYTVKSGDRVFMGNNE